MNNIKTSTLGRAGTPRARPIVDITADGKATLERIRSDSERLRDLGNEAKASVSQAVARAEELVDSMIARLFENGAKVMREKIEEIERAIRK
jgi:DNA-binding PadR family transcriptional regulator